MASLIDTNILVYRFDPRFPQKQRVADEVLRRCIAEDSISEDFQHDRLYGTVRASNPFLQRSQF